MTATPKTISYIAPNTITGSTNELRNDIGAAWISEKQTIAAPSASSMLTWRFQGLSTLYPEHTYSNIYEFTSFDRDGTVSTTTTGGEPYTSSPDTWLQEITSLSKGLRYVELQPVYQLTASLEKLVPNYVVPGRFYGAANESGGAIGSDQEWKTYLMGGTFGDTTYKGIYSETEFSDFSFSYIVPYAADEVVTLGLTAATASINYSYNLYLPEVEKRNRTKSEILLPNMELIRIQGASTFVPDKNIDNFMTLDGRFPTSPWSVLTPAVVNYLPPTSPVEAPNQGGYYDLTKNLRSYLITGSQVELFAPTTTAAGHQLKNLMYGREYAQLLTPSHRLTGDSEGVLEKYPFYVTIGFPSNLNTAYESTLLRQAFEDSAYDERFLLLLKESFGGSTNLSGEEYVTSTLHDEMGIGTETIGSTTLASKDLIKMMIEGSNTAGSNTDFLFVASPDSYIAEDRRLKSHSRNSMRFIHGRSLLEAMSKIGTFLNGNLSGPYSSVEIPQTTAGKNRVYNILNQAGSLSNYHETIAYRIEKKRTAGTGPALQNVWIYNDRVEEANGTPYTFKDSQIKYDESYTYTIYAYVIVAGLTHKMGDLIIGRNMATAITEEAFNASTERYGAVGANCIEFYNPATNEPAEQIFSKLASTSGITYAAADETHGYLNYIKVAHVDSSLWTVSSGHSQFATNAQTVSEFPYLADFNFYYEPGLKVMEIPIFSRALSVVDHPPGGLDVVPFQKIDNSQTLGFFIKVESFEPSMAFPTPITDADREYRTQYLDSNELLPGSNLPSATVSDQSSIQIFRMDQKPQSLTEYKDHLYKTIPLRIKGTAEYLSTYVFYDKVSANKKYYYLMRFVNEHGQAGHSSPTIEAEIINDGGYKYSLFDNLFVEELGAPGLTTPSTTFKKLMHILPTTSQLFLQPNNIDFQQPASQALADELIQVGITDDSIFDQEFKLRLTSKKTGKKIDLNLTFNLTTES